MNTVNDDIVDQKIEIISVGELNRSAKHLLENAFNNISVVGEISNMSRPSSGHIYFTLKDEDGAIGCAMWRSQASKLNFSPENGDKCILKGQVSIYPASGRYQLMVKSIEQAGSGNLMQQFEDLKKKLDREGLFDVKNKLPLPDSPKHIAVITSASTAAFQDILSTIKRRAPSAQISLSKAVVQGDTAPRTIIKALERIIVFNENNIQNQIDTVILARGGGSIEDLWCFNNEDLAREISAFPLPTISGVGHEIDFTICDFVSDIRSPTPTAAAELVSEFNFKALDKLDSYFHEITSRISHSLKLKRHSISAAKSNLKSPLTILREQNQKLDNLELRIKQSIKLNSQSNNQNLNNYYLRLMEKNPKNLLQQLETRIKNISKILEMNIKNKLSIKAIKIRDSNKNLMILNPLSILDRGYSIIQNKKGKAIKGNSDVSVGENLTARLSEGFLEIEVKDAIAKK